MKKIFTLLLTLTMMSLIACTGKSALKKADESIGDETGNNVTDLESEVESVAASSKVNSAAASSQKVTSKSESKLQSTSKSDNSSKEASSVMLYIKDTVELSEEQEIRIKNDFLDFYFGDSSNSIEDYTIEGVKIKHYFGTYNGCVVMFINGYQGFGQALRAGGTADISFKYSSAQGFEIWKNGDFYDLDSAYEKGILTKPDIEAINKIHREKYKYLY